MVIACSLGTNGLGASGGDAAVIDVMIEPDVAVALDADADGDGGEEAALPDVVTEATPQYSCNASNCGGACCENQCVPRNCAGCATGSLFCPYDLSLSGSNGLCVESCAACTANGSNAPTACYTCGGGLTLAQCATNPSSCPQTLSAGACPCGSVDASDCPGSGQTCVDAGAQGVCLSH